MANVRVQKLWRRLAQTYGARLADQYGPTCPQEWCEVINRTDDERLEQALIAVRREHLQFPPTLGQFEAAIPERRRFTDSLPDRLAQHAVAHFKLCEHQLQQPWSHFGPVIDDGGPAPRATVRGVVIPECKHKGCFKFGKPGHRVMDTELTT